jgi:hypothetical protein
MPLMVQSDWAEIFKKTNYLQNWGVKYIVYMPFGSTLKAGKISLDDYKKLEQMHKQLRKI